MAAAAVAPVAIAVPNSSAERFFMGERTSGGGPLVALPDFDFRGMLFHPEIVGGSLRISVQGLRFDPKSYATNITNLLLGIYQLILSVVALSAPCKIGVINNNLSGDSGFVDLYYYQSLLLELCSLIQRGINYTDLKLRYRDDKSGILEWYICN